MKQLKFFVQGSAMYPYEVVFTKHENGQLSASCNCEAGVKKIACKHRLRILSGSLEDIVNGSMDQMMTIQDWLKGTELEQAMTAVKSLEREQDIIKKRVADSKKMLSRTLQTPS